MHRGGCFRSATVNIALPCRRGNRRRIGASESSHSFHTRNKSESHANLTTFRSDGRTRAWADHYANPPSPRFIVSTIDAKEEAQTLLDAVMHSLALLCAVVNAFWLPGAQAGLARLAKGGNVRFVDSFDCA